MSHPTDHYCAYLVKIRPLGTEAVFDVIWRPDWVGNFRKVMQANRNYSHGVILRNKPFEEKLWSEMIDRYELGTVQPSLFKSVSFLGICSSTLTSQPCALLRMLDSKCVI